MAEHLILLAAGSARRFGENKLLRPLNGKPLYAHGLAALLAAAKARPNAGVTVVSRTPEILAAGRAAGAKAVESPLSERGLSFTIKAALDALEPLAESDYLLFAVADQPFLTAASVAALLEQAAPPTLGATLCFGETVGSPTLFSASLANGLRALKGDSGGRAVLCALGDKCLRVQAKSARELEDIDLPGQLPGGT
ncbi:NTP transferase domain-containing protein [Candidatus Allofournierella excrementigallinarum]|uniref:nucleotidyltransferase family protein n=1 Tax=Candidatus Allofournierella excrementigallinarum TaxID=2838592 RepID=UPI00374F9537